VKFLVDAQLPPALARVLTAQGFPSEHVEDLGLRHAKDTPIWNYALANGQAIITKDEDFASRSSVTATCPPVVWLRVPNCSRRALLQWFIPQLPHINAALEQGTLLIEVR
jgi:predicted nuclease of predicted toxin-antitoxin system